MNLVSVPCMVVLLLWMSFPGTTPREGDPAVYRQECSKGMTIYCLALGMQEKKSGNLEQALKYYQSACENHPTQGHLRACTPYLSLAKEMQRLAPTAAPFESRCRSGEEVVCFYLAKEYLKINEYDRAYNHLGRLCRDGYRPPDPADYGPCYHFGDSLLKTGDPGRAWEIFKFDCDRDAVNAKPSCGQYEALIKNIEKGEFIRGGGVKKINPAEMLLFLFVLMPPLGWALLEKGGKQGWSFLRWPVPVLLLVTWVAWEIQPTGHVGPPAELAFILPSVGLVLCLARQAHRRIQNPDRAG